MNVGHRLLNESFDCLRRDMNEMSDVSVQNAFRQSANCADHFTHADSIVQNSTLVSRDVFQQSCSLITSGKLELESVL